MTGTGLLGTVADITRSIDTSAHHVQALRTLTASTDHLGTDHLSRASQLVASAEGSAGQARAGIETLMEAMGLQPDPYLRSIDPGVQVTTSALRAVHEAQQALTRARTAVDAMSSRAPGSQPEIAVTHRAAGEADMRLRMADSDFSNVSRTLEDAFAATLRAMH